MTTLRPLENASAFLFARFVYRRWPAGLLFHEGAHRPSLLWSPILARPGHFSFAICSNAMSNLSPHPLLTLSTLEGHEVSLCSQDHVKLAGWPGIDLMRLHTIGDEVFAEVGGKPHSISLDGMLALMGMPEKSPPTPIEVVQKTCAACGTARPLDAFGNPSSEAEDEGVHCRPCANKLSRERKRNNKIAALSAGLSEKHCPHCKTTKPVSEFKPTLTSADGYMTSCIPCRAAKLKANEAFRAAAEALAARPASSPTPGGRLDFFRLSGRTAFPPGALKAWEARRSAEGPQRT